MKTKTIIWISSIVIGLALIGLLVWYLTKGKDKSASSDIDPDKNIGDSDADEANMASSFNIDVNKPGWRAIWKAEKAKMKKAGMTKKDIKAAKAALKQGKVQTGKGWAFGAALAQTAAQVAGSMSGQGATE